MDNKKNLLARILYEAKSYRQFEDIESLVEKGVKLSQLPIHPLYVSLLNTSSTQVAEILSKLSQTQRQALRDLDFWNKDIVEPESFEYWLDVYSKVREEDVIKEFVQSDDFFLYLKSRINLHTFDVEDPQYPDHDYYFLTDDSLLLVEYGEDYRFGEELKYFIRHLYDELGVENAYTTLFKLMNDSFSFLQETEYVDKKERLRDFGFVDYYEAREALFPFHSLAKLDQFIDRKQKYEVEVDITAKGQSLHSSALVSFDSPMDGLLEELSLVGSEKRQYYLHFNFVRLINASISLKEALRASRVELTQIGNDTKAALEIALAYIKERRTFATGECLFDFFDFTELYKIGQSLWNVERTSLKKSLRTRSFYAQEKTFIGQWWSQIFDMSFESPPKCKNFGVARHPSVVDRPQVYEFWRNQLTTLKELAPFIEQFHKTFSELRDQGKLNDQFYLNYEAENIDFEALLLSSFVNFSLGNFSEGHVNKMGLTIGELRRFIQTFFERVKEEDQLKPRDNDSVAQALEGFARSFGMENISGFQDYLYAILYEHLSGYDFESLEDQDFAHVGGPVLLNTLVKN